MLLSHPQTKIERNYKLCKLFTSGKSIGELASKFKISRARVQQIIWKAERCYMQFEQFKKQPKTKERATDLKLLEAELEMAII